MSNIIEYKMTVCLVAALLAIAGWELSGWAMVRYPNTRLRIPLILLTSLYSAEMYLIALKVNPESGGPFNLVMFMWFCLLVSRMKYNYKRQDISDATRENEAPCQDEDVDDESEQYT